MALASPRRAFAGLALSFGALAATFLPGIQSTSAQPLHAGAVYTISNATTGNQVLAFNRGHDGQLTSAGAFSTGGDGNGGSLGTQGAIALSANGRFLVTVNAASNTIALLEVTPAGLSLLDTSPAQGLTPVSITIDGDLVYAVNDGSDNIAGFRIEDGQLQPIAGSDQPLAAGAAPGQISFDSDGDNLIVTVKNTNEIVNFPVDSDGVAGPGSSTSSAAPTPFGFAIDRHNHAIVSEAPGSDLSSYQVPDNGAVTLLEGPIANGQAAACWVVLSKDGRFAFSSNAGNATISTYGIDQDGELTLLFPVAGNTIGGPQDLAVSNDGRYLYAISRAAHTITEFAINNDGSLILIGSIDDLAMSSSNGLVAR